MSTSSGQPSEQVDRRIGTVLEGKYRLERKLGKGGMGSVYLATHLGIKKRVAVKLLHEQFEGEHEVIQRFRREAIAASAIRHPNIVEVTDFGTGDDGAVFMVLEYLEGTDWGAAKNRLGLGETLRIAEQVCDAVGAAHDAGIIHRDLKLENVFLARHGENELFVKVLDFGVSKMLSPETPGVPTRTGSAIGTPYYMSPEQLAGDKDIDHRTDIYAIGVMLYRALAGRYPYEAETIATLVFQVLTEAPPPLVSLRPDLSPALIDLVERMISKKREARPADCKTVLRELRAIRSSSSPAAPAIGDPREVDALAVTQDSLAELPARLSQPVATPAPAPEVASASAAVVSAPPRSAPELAYDTQELAVDRPSLAITPPPSRPLPLRAIAIGVAIAAVAAIAIVWATSGSPDADEPAVTAEPEPEAPREEPALPAGMDTPPPLEPPVEEPALTESMRDTPAMTARMIEATMAEAAQLEPAMLETAMETPVETMEEPVVERPVVTMALPDLLHVEPGTRMTQ